MIIDVHTHLGKFGAIPKNSAQELIASMDEADIDMSLVIANKVGEHRDGDSTQETVEALKDFPRLRAIGNIDITTLDEDEIAQLKQYLEKEEIVGIKLYPGYQEFSLLDERLQSLYRVCAEKQYPVMIHTGFLLQGVNGLLKYSHPLLVDELAHNFPNLRIIMAHFGTPWTRDTAAVLAKNQHVYADVSGYFTEFQSISKKEIGEFKESLKELSAYAGGLGKCLFGSDWPIYSQKEYVKAVQALPMSDEECDLVFYKNAQQLFHLT